VTKSNSGRLTLVSVPSNVVPLVQL
jgi:hypothetical protein